MKESFLLYKSFYEPTAKMSLEDKGRLWDAIMIYQKTGEEISLPPNVEMAFQFIKNQFRLDQEKYNERIERNRVNGSKSQGRPKKPKKPTGLTGNPKNLTGADNDNGNGNDTVNELKFPTFFDTECFDQWNKLLKSKHWKKKNVAQLQTALDKLSRYDRESVFKALEDAVIGDYQAIFPKDIKPASLTPQPKQAVTDLTNHVYANP